MSIISGVYRIVNKINGKYYIGSSIDIDKRWKYHLSESKQNRYKYPLYNAIRKYGKDNFILEVIQQCDISDLEYIEQTYLDKHVGNKTCYNISNSVFAPMRGRTHTTATKTKISKTKLNNYTQELGYKTGKAWRGKKQPQKLVDKRIQKLIGQKRTIFVRKELSNIAKKRYDIHGKSYPILVHMTFGIIPAGKNISRLAIKLGIEKSGLCKLVSGRTNSYKGWRVYV